MGRACNTHGELRKAYIILVRKLGGKRPLGRHRHRWEDNIRKDLRETGWEVVDLIHMGQDSDQWQALVKTIMNLQWGIS
jgi:hypothetical protein